MKAVAYSRVSTLLNQDPELQLTRIRELATNRSFTLVNEYVDKGISGAKESRPALDELLKDARQGKFKIVIVTGIDRIARNVRHLLNLIHELSGYGVAVISLRESLDFTTPMGQATLTILGAIAQLERELIRERIRTALAAKKMNALRTGSKWKCGRPTVITPHLVEQVRELKTSGMSIRTIEKALNKAISRSSTLASLLKSIPRVKEWVFLNQFGRQLSASQIDDAIIRLQKHHPEMKRWRCHDLRHSFAYNFLKQGGNMYQLQAILGHRSIQMTIDLYGQLQAVDVGRVDLYQN